MKPADLSDAVEVWRSTGPVALGRPAEPLEACPVPELLR